MAPNRDDEDTGSWKAPGRQLRSDGQITGEFPQVNPPSSDSDSEMTPFEALNARDLVLDRTKLGQPLPERDGGHVLRG